MANLPAVMKVCRVNHVKVDVLNKHKRKRKIALKVAMSILKTFSPQQQPYPATKPQQPAEIGRISDLGSAAPPPAADDVN